MEKTDGFSLLELLIAIGIIGIVTAIVIPNLISANIRARINGVRADIGSIAIALEDYKADNGAYPKDPRYARVGASYTSDVIAEPNQTFDGKGGSDSDDNDDLPF